MSTTDIVRAIDLGYGNVKYTRRSGDGKLEFHEFPSLAVPELSDSADHFESSGLPNQVINTVVVRMDDHLYHVGPESPVLVQGQGVEGRELDTSYSKSASYRALMRGALAYMDEPVIDCLVLGLPVSMFGKEESRLAAEWTGVHKVPHATRREARIVEVKRVVVVPQPVGAYMAAVSAGQVSTAAGNALVIDPGYYTIDWVVVSPRMALVHSRSGSILGGVSALLLSLANSLNRELRSPIQILAPLETALRTGRPAHLWGRQFPLDRHMRGVRSKTEGYVSDLVSRLGNHSDIPQIVIAGGGANLFYPALRAKFPVQTIATPDRPEFANVHGFQLIGQNLARLARTGADVVE